ncbi:MAG: hypothetical protein ACNFW9_00780 [Candidatus Kerfeldbacteria bacterium]
MAVDDKNTECPHCNGRTTCTCSSCGAYVTGRGGKEWKKGICKVCGGSGKAR